MEKCDSASPSCGARAFSKSTPSSSSSLELDSGNKDASTTEKEKHCERGRIGQHSLTWKQCYCVISYL